MHFNYDPSILFTSFYTVFTLFLYMICVLTQFQRYFDMFQIETAGYTGMKAVEDLMDLCLGKGYIHSIIVAPPEKLILPLCIKRQIDFYLRQNQCASRALLYLYDTGVLVIRTGGVPKSRPFYYYALVAT